MGNARIGAFFIPGIGTEDDLRRAVDQGLGFVRVGTDVSASDTAQPVVELAKYLGLLVFCNFMKSYAVTSKEFGERAARSHGFGADVVCLVDSAGGMTPDEIRDYMGAAKATSPVALGFHGHDNLCMAMANTLAAFEAGGKYLDASLQGIGRSEGNCVTEVLAAHLQKQGYQQGIDINGLLDISEAFVTPLGHAQRRTALGITSGRARFHSSFMGAALDVAIRYGLDVRRLILALGEEGQIGAPPELLESKAQQLAIKPEAGALRVTLAPPTPIRQRSFENQVESLARDLRSAGRKYGLPSVLNVVVTDYEDTHVSPFVETGYGCAISNIMLSEGALLTSVLEYADGVVDYLLLDTAGASLPMGFPRKSRILFYSDMALWARAVSSHLTALMSVGLSGRSIVVTGVAALSVRVAMTLEELGAHVALDSECGAALAATFSHVEHVSLDTVLSKADAVVVLSPRNPSLGGGVVDQMRGDAILFDGGIGSLAAEAVVRAEKRGIRVVRVDMRPTMATVALESIGLYRVVNSHMGRDTWDSVSVVAGGLIGREGEVIVDSIVQPTRVIGLADGRGGIQPPVLDSQAVRTVREAIARKRLKEGQQAGA